MYVIQNIEKKTVALHKPIENRHGIIYLSVYRKLDHKMNGRFQFHISTIRYNDNLVIVIANIDCNVRTWAKTQASLYLVRRMIIPQ